MANATGEMPFLDHLEELRSRLLKVLATLVVAIGFGIWLVLNFGVIDALKAPIAPFLPDGNLTILAVTEPFLITLKLGALVGLVLASPIIIYQLWAFLSPALYEREKKAMIPALFVGLLLFLLGGWVGWAYIVPKALPVMLGFQAGSFNIMITYQTYFSFVVQIVLALGISAEVPLVMILLAALGIFDARRYNAFRKYAVFLSFVAGALLSPGGDAFLMLLLTLPLLLLYEIGVAGSYLVQRRARRAASIGGGALLVALLGMPAEAAGQVQVPLGRQAPGAARDTLLSRGAGQARQLDSAAAKRLGLPTGPERTFPAPDSIMDALLRRQGFATTRFLADTALLFADSTTIVLKGRAGTERDGAKLEGAQIVYSDDRCELIATGEPKMFEEGKIAIGRVLRFDTCNERGVISDALTSFDELGANWFVRGNLAVDSSASRLYAANSEFTSCDLPVAHYHFRAGEVKWVSQSVLVARPAVLYIRDVPIVWLPFLFQDTKPGRRSGILIPQFGFNDIVRPTRGYRRQVTNIGYYWAPNEYIDLTARLDWFASRYVQYGAELQYAWIDRFINGGIGVNRQVEGDGGSSLQLRWNHSQRFNAATTLVLNLDYATDSRVIAGNAVDPLLTTRQILSSANFTKRFAWGQVTVGGLRRQSITDGSGTMTLPSLTVSPNPLDISRNVTWSPGFSATNESQFKTPQPVQTIITPGGLDSLVTTGRVRNSTMSFDTPLRIGQFNWRNRIAVNDRQTVARTVRSIRIPDLSTPEPDDSITVSQVRDGDFSSGVDWETSINLPIVASGSWKITPSVGVRNITSGPFMLRNAATRGEWVQQGKRLELGIAAAPTFYAFFNRSFGPVHRIRHRVNPLVNFAWNPAATLPEEYARAVAGGNARASAGTPTPSRMTLALGLNQNFEAKLRPAPGDTATDETTWRKVALLEVTTSPLAYDFEQAKLPGRTGWVTQAMTNSVRSDLISGLQLSVTHDLWDGQVGADTARFSPYLANVQANFSLTGNTFRSIGALLGLGGDEDVKRGPAAVPPPPPTYMGSSDRRFRPGSFGGMDATRGLTGRGFQTSVTYSLSRSRGTGPVVGPVPVDPGGFDDPFGEAPIQPIDLTPGIPGTSQSNLGFNASFSPTPFWAVSWQTQYNVTERRFESQQIQLQRDLHDWRASFNFVRGANGNFALFFSVYLMNLPDIKFDYNQTTIQQ
jgi:Tat protein translocase TatC